MKKNGAINEVNIKKRKKERVLNKERLLWAFSFFVSISGLMDRAKVFYDHRYHFNLQGLSMLNAALLTSLSVIFVSWPLDAFTTHYHEPVLGSARSSKRRGKNTLACWRSAGRGPQPRAGSRRYWGHFPIGRTFEEFEMHARISASFYRTAQVAGKR